VQVTAKSNERPKVLLSLERNIAFKYPNLNFILVSFRIPPSKTWQTVTAFSPGDIFPLTPSWPSTPATSSTWTPPSSTTTWPSKKRRRPTRTSCPTTIRSTLTCHQNSPGYIQNLYNHHNLKSLWNLFSLYNFRNICNLRLTWTLSLTRYF